MSRKEKRQARRSLRMELSPAEKAIWLESVRQRRQRTLDDAARVTALHSLRSQR